MKGLRPIAYKVWEMQFDDIISQNWQNCVFKHAILSIMSIGVGCHQFDKNKQFATLIVQYFFWIIFLFYKKYISSRNI